MSLTLSTYRDFLMRLADYDCDRPALPRVKALVEANPEWTKRLVHEGVMDHLGRLSSTQRLANWTFSWVRMDCESREYHRTIHAIDERLADLLIENAQVNRVFALISDEDQTEESKSFVKALLREVNESAYPCDRKAALTTLVNALLTIPEDERLDCLRKAAPAVEDRYNPHDRINKLAELIRVVPDIPKEERSEEMYQLIAQLLWNRDLNSRSEFPMRDSFTDRASAIVLFRNSYPFVNDISPQIRTIMLARLPAAEA